MYVTLFNLKFKDSTWCKYQKILKHCGKMTLQLTRNNVLLFEFCCIYLFMPLCGGEWHLSVPQCIYGGQRHVGIITLLDHHHVSLWYQTQSSCMATNAIACRATILAPNKIIVIVKISKLGHQRKTRFGRHNKNMKYIIINYYIYFM